MTTIQTPIVTFETLVGEDGTIFGYVQEHDGLTVLLNPDVTEAVESVLKGEDVIADLKARAEGCAEETGLPVEVFYDMINAVNADALVLAPTERFGEMVEGFEKATGEHLHRQPLV